MNAILCHLKELCHDNFQYYFGQNRLSQIRTKYLCRSRNTYGTLRKISSEFLEQKINHNQSFSEFSKTEAINLKKLASCLLLDNQ